MVDKNKQTEKSETAETARTESRQMTAHKVMVLAGVVAIVGAAAFAGVAHSDGWSGGWGHHGYGHGQGYGQGYGYGHGGGAAMMGMFGEFDADADGKLTKGEMENARMSRFNAADANSDKTLDVDEFQGMWMTFMRPRMVDNFQMLDENGDGKVTEQEFASPFQLSMRHMDGNNDGAIDIREMDSMHRGGGFHHGYEPGEENENN